MAQLSDPILQSQPAWLRSLDANRSVGQPNNITVIFGRKITKDCRGKLQTIIEDINLPNPVIRSHCGHGFIKQ